MLITVYLLLLHRSYFFSKPSNLFLHRIKKSKLYCSQGCRNNFMHRGRSGVLIGNFSSLPPNVNIEEPDIPLPTVVWSDWLNCINCQFVYRQRRWISLFSLVSSENSSMILQSRGIDQVLQCRKFGSMIVVYGDFLTLNF